MNDYVQVRLDIEPCSETATDLMAGLLCEISFESFMADDSGLTAYVKREEFSPAALEAVIGDFPMPCAVSSRTSVIEGRDWNSEWEKHYFKPVVICDKCVIHASFHVDYPKAEYDIVINPKMAFGTGHHATTSLIMARLLEIPLQGKRVTDMGTGTGILAILASMRGACSVTALDIDPVACENAAENLRLNSADNVRVLQGGAEKLSEIPEADIFMANINRNVITADIGAYSRRLAKGGKMLLSGFYHRDIPILTDAAAGVSLGNPRHTQRGEWACLCLEKL